MGTILEAEVVDIGKPPHDDDRKGRFVYDVDGVTYHHDHPTITGAEIMMVADIPVSEGLVQLLPDGQTKTVGPNDVVSLASRAHFKRRPRFKRG